MSIPTATPTVVVPIQSAPVSQPSAQSGPVTAKPVTDILATIAVASQLVQALEKVYQGGKVDYLALTGLVAVVPHLISMAPVLVSLPDDLENLTPDEIKQIVDTLESQYSHYLPSGWTTDKLTAIASVTSSLIDTVEKAVALAKTLK